MTLRILLITLTFSLLLGIGCKAEKPDSKVSKNDTTDIIKILIDSAFYRQKRIPDFSRLTKNNPFGDTIIFKFDSVLLGHLPKQFKVLTQDEICSLATQYYNDTSKFCNFLELNSFKKLDTTYEISLQNQCVMPLYDRNGKPIFRNDFYKDSVKYKCMFGMLCGGGILMSFKKQGDTFLSKVEGRWSN